MRGEDDDGLDGEGMGGQNLAKRIAQQLNMVGQEGLPTVRQVDREEIGPSGDAATAVVGHWLLVVQAVWIVVSVFAWGWGWVSLRSTHPTGYGLRALRFSGLDYQ